MRQGKKRVRRVLALVLAALLLIPLAGPAVIVPSEAVTREEIDKLKQDASSLAGDKKKLQEELKAVQADKSKALEQKDLLERQIGVIQAEINNISAQIAQYDQLISEKAAELAQAEQDEREQFDLFCRRVRYMEEQGETSYWSILFESKDFSELLDNYMMIDEIVQYDNAVMDKLAAIRGRVAQDKADLEAARAEQEEAKRQQQEAKAELKRQEDQVEKLIGEISAQESQLKAMEESLKKAADELDAQIRKKEKELAAQLANVVSESGFRWPLEASRNTLTSLYGPRTHPVTGRPNNHTGIDIPAPKNSKIYAAKSGIVATSTRHGSYGEYVVVAHSDGTSTLYAHMTSRNVKEGQTVKQGDVVGYVGSTGSSTGNHLHFEVRINGSRTDPLNYFKDKALYARDGGKSLPLWDWMK